MASLLKHMNRWSMCLKDSGYGPKERLDTIKGAVLRHKEMQKMVKEGVIRSLHRSRDEIIQKKAEKGGITSSSWFLKGNTAKVIKCQATPDGALARRLDRNLNPANVKERTKVVEEGGAPATASLRRSDPYRKPECRFQDKSCLVDPKQDCSLMGCIYEICCKSCKDPVHQDQALGKITRDPGGQDRVNYVGMTATSVHARMVSHLNDQRSKLQKSPMWRHDRDQHGGEHQEYETRILNREKTLLSLAITEGLYIEAQLPETSLNEKNEKGRGGIIRLTCERVT